MVFNSTTFLVFFAVFLVLFALCRKSLSASNVLILAGSYIFYGWWDVRFLGLLVLTSLMDFAVAVALEKMRTPRGRRGLLLVSICLNLAVLGAFKYYDFFSDSFQQFATNLGFYVDFGTLKVVLPVGISFYTFQSMSYVIDVYRGHLPACRNVVAFLSYISFFPQLVAGPIERAPHLLPQFLTERVIRTDHILDGAWLMIRGFFKKVVIADNLDSTVGLVFNFSGQATAPLALLGAFAFGFQIYCDFSGYSDLARGTAKWLGFDLMVNFDRPYFSRSIGEFWRRWHISLSTWIRDYIYFPLGGNRCTPSRNAANLMATMMLAGLWHGAALNFVLWGMWHGMALIVGRTLGRFGMVVNWVWMWGAVLYGWILFRARDMTQVYNLTAAFTDWSTPFWFKHALTVLALFCLPVLLLEWIESAIATTELRRRRLVQWASAPLLLAIIFYWERRDIPFIYFQF